MESPPKKSDTYVPERQKPTGSTQGAKGFIRPVELILAAPIPRVFLHSPYMQRSIVLTQRQEWSIGRSKDCDIVLPDRWASRHHSIIRVDPQKGYHLVDNKSMNGSFVNNQRVFDPHLLKHGDRVMVGETELEFVWINSGTTPPPTCNESKCILMTHSSRTQGEMWRELLNSQGLSTIWATSHFELEKVMAHIESLNDSPDLLLLDLGMPKTNPYDFCRRYHETYPNLQVILLSGMRQLVHDSECKWAMNQGATALLPGLPRENLFGDLTRITERLQTIFKGIDWHQMNAEALTSTLLKLQEAVDSDLSGIIL